MESESLTGAGEPKYGECDVCDGQGVCGTQPRDPQKQQIWDCTACDGTGVVRL